MQAPLLWLVQSGSMPRGTTELIALVTRPARVMMIMRYFILKMLVIADGGCRRLTGTAGNVS